LHISATLSGASKASDARTQSRMSSLRSVSADCADLSWWERCCSGQAALQTVATPLFSHSCEQGIFLDLIAEAGAYSRSAPRPRISLSEPQPRPRSRTATRRQPRPKPKPVPNQTYFHQKSVPSSRCPPHSLGPSTCRYNLITLSMCCDHLVSAGLRDMLPRRSRYGQ